MRAERIVKHLCKKNDWTIWIEPNDGDYFRTHDSKLVVKNAEGGQEYRVKFNNDKSNTKRAWKLLAKLMTEKPVPVIPKEGKQIL